MTEEKGIQITRGTEGKGIQITRGIRDTSKTGSRFNIEINRTGKPAIGQVPELLELNFRCGVTKRDFRVLIEGEQTARGNHYKVVEVLKVDSSSQKHTVSSYQSKNKDISVENIEGISSLKCPYCRGSKSTVIKCGCGGLSCGGGVRKEGNRHYHECPWCGSIGIITGHIETLSGEKKPSREILGDREKSKPISKQVFISNEASLKTLPPGNKQVQKR